MSSRRRFGASCCFLRRPEEWPKKKPKTKPKKPKAVIPDDPVVHRWLSQQSMTALSSPALELARQKSLIADVATKKPPIAGAAPKSRKTAPMTADEENRSKYQGGNQRDLEKIEKWKQREAEGEVALCELCPPIATPKKKKAARVFENELVIRSLTISELDTSK